jgi:hypothetical protein
MVIKLTRNALAFTAICVSGRLLAADTYSLRCIGNETNSTNDSSPGNTGKINLLFTLDEPQKTFYYFCGRKCLGMGRLRSSSTELSLEYRSPKITFEDHVWHINRVTGSLSSEMRSGPYIGGLYFYSTESGSCEKVPLVRPPASKF